MSEVVVAQLADLRLTKRKGKSNQKPGNKIFDVSSAPVDLKGSDVYECEAVVHHRRAKSGGGLEFLVSWKGYSSEEWSWVKKACCTRQLLR